MSSVERGRHGHHTNESLMLSVSAQCLYLCLQWKEGDMGIIPMSLSCFQSQHCACTFVFSEERETWASYQRVFNGFGLSTMPVPLSSVERGRHGHHTNESLTLSVSALCLYLCLQCQFLQSAVSKGTHAFQSKRHHCGQEPRLLYHAQCSER